MTTPRGKIVVREPMKNHTSFGIGGDADLFFLPDDEEDLKRGLAYAAGKNLPTFILGNGSNILVSDEGIRGMVIHLQRPAFRQLLFEETSVTAGAGAKTGTVLHEAIRRNFGGIEFLGAVPGTMGGVFFMNAGTYLGEIAGVVRHVRVLDESLHSRVLLPEELEYQYRRSIFQKKPWVILEGKISLTPMEKSDAQAKVNEILDRRRKTQPLQVRSAGSAFKNPPGASAWQLIEKAGLRGFSIGDAAVADTHSNFIINKGTATASQVFQVIRHIQEQVHEKFGILLEPEIRLVGYWRDHFLSPQDFLSST